MKTIATLAGCALAALSFVAESRAAQFVFTVDPAQSFLAITSTTSVFGSPLDTTAQAPHSTGVNYSGSIHADVTASTIQFLAPSTLVAGNSGNWLPGTDYSNYPDDLEAPDGYVNTPLPANYGLVTDLTPLGEVLGKQGLSPSAIRDLAIGLLDAAPKPLAGGVFDESGTATDFTSGTVYYSSGGAPPITDLANTVAPGPTLDAQGQGTLVVAGDTQILTLPVHFSVTYSINFLSVTTVYNGSIVATALVPEPASGVLVALGGLALVVCAYRRTARRCF